MENRRGVKTSEFYVTLAAMILGAVAYVLAAAVPDTHWSVQVVAIALEALAALGYTASRAKVKTEEQKTSLLQSLNKDKDAASSATDS